MRCHTSQTFACSYFVSLMKLKNIKYIECIKTHLNYFKQNSLDLCILKICCSLWGFFFPTSLILSLMNSFSYYLLSRKLLFSIFTLLSLCYARDSQFIFFISAKQFQRLCKTQQGFIQSSFSDIKPLKLKLLAIQFCIPQP